MIKIKVTISDEELSQFYKKTNQVLKPDLDLHYIKDDVTNEYYLAFADDMIVIKNTSITLDNGIVTEQSVLADFENNKKIQEKFNKNKPSSNFNSGL